MFDEVFTALSEIISSQYSVKASTGSSHILQESGIREKIAVSNTGKLTVYKFDKKRVKGHNLLFDLFDCKKEKVCKMCDYIIVSHSENKLFVFLIELKSNNPDGPIQQILAGYLLSNYIFQTLKRISDWRMPQIEFRGLIFSGRAPIKGTTKSDNLGYKADGKFDLKYLHLGYSPKFSLNRYMF